MGNGKAASGDGGVNGYNTLNHFLAPHFRSPLSLSLNGGGSGKGDHTDSSLRSPTFVMLQAVEQENEAASGRKRKRAAEEEEEDEDDDDDDDEEDEDIASRQLKSSHTASLMLSHTPPHSYSSSPRNGSSSLSMPLLTPLFSALGGTLDGDEEEDSAPSSPSAGAAAAAASESGQPAAADDTMLLQLTDTASSFSALNTLSTLGNGSSCHQCKSLRPVNQLMYCCNNKKRGSKASQQQRDATKPSCRKKFCDVCLAKFYGQKPSSDDMIRSGTDSSWECPSCVGICTCAACRRRKETGGGATGSAGKGKGGAKKKVAVELATAEQKEQKEQPPPATPAAHTNGHAASNGSSAAADTLSVPPAASAASAPLSPLTLSPRNKGVHMEYVEGEDSPAVIHIARDSIVLPPTYSPRLTPKADNGNGNGNGAGSQPMEVDVQVETTKAE